MSVSVTKLRSVLGNYLAPRRYPPIVVLESDDWGSIRTSNAEACEVLKDRGYALKRSVYSADCIETPQDILDLEAVLTRHVSRSGSHPRLTANFVMANPDFEAVRASGFAEYSYTPWFDERVLFDGAALATAWSEAIRRGAFMPQLHCREHIKWWDWLRDLRQPESDAVRTFDLAMCGVPKACSPTGTSYFEPVYVDDAFTAGNPTLYETTITEGARLFEAHFGHRSETTIAPVGYWNDRAEAIWRDLGITGIQSPWVQSLIRHGAVGERARFLGQTNSHGQTYLVRNCTFEPRKSLGTDRCFPEIQRAFRFGKPAIISTHRVNYVAGIDPAGARAALLELDRLLGQVLAVWPDTEFLTSNELMKTVIDNA